MPHKLALLALLIPGGFFAFHILITEQAQRRFNLDIQKRGQCTDALILRYSKDRLVYVEYQYKPDGAQMPIVSRKAIDVWKSKRVPAGSTVRVWYLPNQPTISVLEPYLYQQNAIS